MPSDSDVVARAGELVADVYRALSIMDPVPPTDAEYMAVAEIARAGLALRERCFALEETPGMASLLWYSTPAVSVGAYDAAIRAALGTDADAGAAAGEAGT